MGDKTGNLSNTQKKYLTLAVSVARLHPGKFKHGAVLVKSGRVLATAPNIYKNNPDLFSRENPNNAEEQAENIRKFCSVHAEVRVVRSVTPEQARGSVVYVARVKRDNLSQAMISRPCKNCHKFLTEAGVKSVVYTEGELQNFAEAA